MEQPGGDGQVWLSNRGNVLWRLPDEEEAVTFEERTLPEYGRGVDQTILDLETPNDAQWRKLYYGLTMETEPTSIDQDGDPQIAVAMTGILDPGNKYFVSPHGDLEEENAAAISSMVQYLSDEDFDNIGGRRSNQCHSKRN